MAYELLFSPRCGRGGFGMCEAGLNIQHQVRRYVLLWLQPWMMVLIHTVGVKRTR